MNIPTDYAEAPHADYKCTQCGSHGCKLWREYQTCSDYTVLECCECAGASQKYDVSTMDAHGDWAMPMGDHTMQTCTIGWRVPAIPVVGGDTFWGYSSIPKDGLTWWRRLPSRPAHKGAK